MNEEYYVARVYSHTDRQLLWKIVSRPFKNKPDAEDWAKFNESLEPDYKFFVVTVELDN